MTARTFAGVGFRLVLKIPSLVLPAVSESISPSLAVSAPARVISPPAVFFWTYQHYKSDGHKYDGPKETVQIEPRNDLINHKKRSDKNHDQPSRTTETMRETSKNSYGNKQHLPAE